MRQKTDRVIQILRIVACGAVFFCHFGQRLYLNSISPILYSFSQLGKYGVELFFIISGYLACLSLSKEKNTAQFYKKRIISILPLYYFCILYYFVTETFVFQSIPEDDMHLGWFRYIFCLNGIVPSDGYFWSNIGITWTIPVFLAFYMLAPVLVRIAKSTFSSSIILIITIAISLIIKTKLQGWFSAFLFMPCFLMGVVVYNAKKEEHRAITTMGLLVFVIATEVGRWNGYIPKTDNLSKIFMISAIFASIILVSDELILKDKKLTKTLDVLDEHAYTLYLVHGMTFCGIIDKFGISFFGKLAIAVAFRLAVSILGTVILTVVIHRYIEKPIQKKLSTKLLNKE